jgi:nucleoside-diphosphate-sugar epimerase
MKAEVEHRFLGHTDFKSIRLSYVFSKADKLTRYLAKCATDGTVAEVFDPFDRAVIHREDVLDGVLRLVSQWHDVDLPTINFAGPEVLSRSQFAQALRDTAFPSLKYTVVEPEASFFENRPRSINMTSAALSYVLGRAPRRIPEAAKFEFNL